MGNPGTQYARSRHNVGWWVADLIRERYHAYKLMDQGPSRIAHLRISGEAAVIAYPKTYVNRSGVAAIDLIRRYSSDIQRLLVISDDINLPPGRLRIRRRGGAGGHNGLKSVIDALNDDGFLRIRIGVGKQGAGDSQVDHVLGDPAGEELEAIEGTVAGAADAVGAVVTDGIEKAMNRFN